ncbi:MAG: hypothetical protein HY791_13805 [Deltaproteobacteria bacterium]|nr:hypothetical protein [Deltaproteobacteria bacterium]
MRQSVKRSFMVVVLVLFPHSGCMDSDCAPSLIVRPGFRGALDLGPAPSVPTDEGLPDDATVLEFVEGAQVEVWLGPSDPDAEFFPIDAACRPIGPRARQAAVNGPALLAFSGHAAPLTVEIRDVDSCAAEPIVIHDSGAHIVRDFANARRLVEGSCTQNRPQLAFEIELPSAADLTVDAFLFARRDLARRQVGAVPALVTNSCGGGPELACGNFLRSVASGKHFVFIETSENPRTSEVEIRILPGAPSTPPSNTSCEHATLLESTQRSATLPVDLRVRWISDPVAEQFWKLELDQPAIISVNSTSTLNSTVPHVSFDVDLLDGNCNPMPYPGGLGYSPACSGYLEQGTYFLRARPFDDYVVAGVGVINLEIFDAPRPPNDDCDDAASLPNQVGWHIIEGSYVSAAESVNPFGARLNGLYYALELTERSDIHVSYEAAQLSGYAFAGTCGEPRFLGRFLPRGLFGVGPGLLHLHVGAAAFGGCADTTFHLSYRIEPSGPRPSNDACVDALPISFPGIDIPVTFFGSTRGAASEREPDPNSFGRPVDVFYRIDLAEPSVLHAVATPASVVVKPSCGPADLGAGVDPIRGVELPAGSYFLAVESVEPIDYLLNLEITRR